MVYIPEIIDYKPFYIQTDVDENAVDTTAWGLIARTTPFPLFPSPKDPYKNEWLDEDGDDEYLGETHFEAFEIDVQFHIITKGTDAVESLVSQVEAFRDKIWKGQFMIYDSYTGIGRRNVRYAGGNIENFRDRIRKGFKASCDLTIKLKVNDPVTRVILANGKLVEG